MKIYVVNGAPGAGKTTFENTVETLSYSCDIISTIDPIKERAFLFGWNGEKDAKGRRLLYNLKRAWVEYGDQPYTWLEEIFNLARYGGTDVIFVDCREPEEIKEICKRFGAKSLLIRRAAAENSKTSNESDKNVLNYDYDIVIENNGSKYDLTIAAENFIEKEGITKRKGPYCINLFGEIVK